VTEPFHGAKIAILVGDQIVTILRDNTPSILWPDHWDLPGGGRENGENPTECALRELHEELGLIVDPAKLTWLTQHASPPSFVWFLVAEWPEWRLISIEWFLSHERTIPHHKERLRTYLQHRESRSS